MDVLTDQAQSALALSASGDFALKDRHQGLQTCVIELHANSSSKVPQEHPPTHLNRTELNKN